MGLNCRLVDFDSFTKILNRPGGFRDPGEPEEYCRGFQVFDKDLTGFIGVGQLRYSMSSFLSILSNISVESAIHGPHMRIIECDRLANRHTPSSPHQPG